MSKKAYYLIAALVLLFAGYFAFAPSKTPTTPESTAPVTTPADGQVAAATDTKFIDGAYYISTSESTVKWEGSKTLIANYKDIGTLGIKDGSFVVTDGKVSSGKVIFDMTTITSTATNKAGGEDALTKHLKSDSFFSVEKFPTSEFTVKSVTKNAAIADSYVITGDLTIKDITHEVSFIATAQMNGGALVIDGRTQIDRTLWDIRFGSAKFFDDLANNVIDDMFTVELHLIARAEESK